MFYSETLLSKTGPLARVWLSANLERKLSKAHILQSNIESSVGAIVQQDQAPMALRLSGQLLLGVVRIYSRKARYLLDDCNEALMKIKMAFRPGNVDLPSNQMHVANPSALTLPDVLTENDLLMPLVSDPSLLLSQPSGTAGLDLDIMSRVGRNEDITLMDWSSQVQQDSAEIGRDDRLHLEDDDLVLDIGDDFVGGVGDGTSVHVGRDAAPPRQIEDDLLSDDMKLHDGDDLVLDFGDGPDLAGAPTGEFPSEPLGDHFNFDMEEDGGDMVFPELEQEQPRAQRDSQSPLSSIRSSAERQLQNKLDPNVDSAIFEPPEDEDPSVVQPSRAAKKRKVLQPDESTELRGRDIRSQQEDRSRILKPASFLPRDPMLLTLMAMQKNGGFVSNILGDGRGKGWAPEIRGVLSLELVRRSGELKRKRDSGIGLDEEEEEARKTPRLEIDEEGEAMEFGAGDDGFGADQTGGDGEVFNIPGDDDVRLVDDDGIALAGEEGEEDLSPQGNFDDTTAPLIHPADNGPVSQGTKHAVHLLRERFGGTTGTPKKSASVLFQDLLPQQTTNKSDATKMFFEVLVLATKDAVKVEQDGEALGANIRLRAKRGLWGAWAEKDAGGEIAQQEGTQTAGAVEVAA